MIFRIFLGSTNLYNCLGKKIQIETSRLKNILNLLLLSVALGILRLIFEKFVGYPRHVSSKLPENPGLFPGLFLISQSNLVHENCGALNFQLINV